MMDGLPLYPGSSNADSICPLTVSLPTRCMLKRQRKRMHPNFFTHQTMNSLAIGIDAEHYLHREEYKTHQRIHCELAGSLSRSRCYHPTKDERLGPDTKQQ